MKERARHRDEDDPAVDFLLKRFDFSGGHSASEPCPGENRLSGYVENRLLDEEREGVERHLLRCERCRRFVMVMGRELAFEAAGGGVGKEARSIRRAGWKGSEGPAWSRLRLRTWAVAAAVLVVCVGLAILGPDLVRALFPGIGGARSTDERLFAAARDLAETEPGLFGGFTPLDREERLAPDPDRVRGLDVALLHPAGKVLEVRPSFRWEPVPGAERYILALYTADGSALFSRECDGPEAQFPATAVDLEPGSRYIWEVSCDGPLGVLESRRVFEVAGSQERETVEACVRKIDSLVPAEIRSLVKAHLFLRHGLYGEAEEAVRACLDEQAGDRVARETLLYVLERHGSSEADALRAALEQPLPDP